MFKKDGSVWMIQADHLTGETLGEAVQRFLDIGVMNVQVVPTLTKKNRPGHLILLDMPESINHEEVEHVLVHELGIAGYHRLVTEHVHEPSKIITQDVRVKNSEKSFKMRVNLKLVGTSIKEGYLRAEHDSLREVNQAIYKEFGKMKSLKEIASIVEAGARQGGKEVTIEV